jgi:predicted flap endonuclease-1-like 5' DNA nuclease
MNWASFLIGVFVGWMIERPIDVFIGRRRRWILQNSSDTQAKVKELELKIEDLRAHLNIHHDATTLPGGDDLTEVEGIGPKIAAILKDHHITTFAQLAETEIGRLHQILEEAGPHFKLADPETWPEQAKLAAKGDWAGFKKLKDDLIAGRHRKG